MKSFFLLLFSFTFSLNVFAQNLSLDQKVDSLLNLMTLDEKIGQMTQAERGALEKISDIGIYGLGSLLSGGGSGPAINSAEEWSKMYDKFQLEALKSRLGIPMIYAVDAVHGHNNVKGAVIFPHNIGLGCTWNTDLVKAVNQASAKEVAATGIDWTFSPCIAVPQNERWGRTYEGFGETAEIQKLMAGPSVQGLQGDDLSLPETVLACAKHFVGDGGTTNGIDQGNTVVSEEVLRSKHMSGYIDAINANVGTVMASYSSWNGLKLHGHQYLLTDVLKDELGFKGFVISDWKGVDQVNEDYREAIKRAINSGVDMVMVPDRYLIFINILKDLVEKDEVSIDRINDAVSRILKQKFLLNMFKKPLTDQTLLASVGSAPHRTIAQQAVRESLVLLSAKNNVLPLKKDNQRILVAGDYANDIGAQCGGWTIYWQGGTGSITDGTSILKGIQNLTGTSEVVYSAAGTSTGTFDIAVVVIGENPYAEGAGDRESLNVQEKDVALVRKLKGLGIPVVTVLLSGRPMIIGSVLPYSDAFIAAWLPGTEGEGVAEVLFGDYIPTGKLSHTWPRMMSQIPINFGDINYDPLFAYKHGLDYFPSSANNLSLNPYGANLNKESNKISLTLTDGITSLNYESGDFSIKMDNVDITHLIDGVSISTLDNTALEFTFASPLDAVDANISISYSGTGVLSSDILLNHFQGFYVFNESVNYGTPIKIPAKIQAESFAIMSGVGVENTSDVGGGQNVGWIEKDDWMEYAIEVATSGEYILTARLAGTKNTNLIFNFEDQATATIKFTATGDWQTWKDYSTSLYLESGEYIMRVTASSDGVNINYFNFTANVVNSTIDPIGSDIQVFPNPLNTDFQLKMSSKVSERVSIKLYDMSGILYQVLYMGNLNHGLNDFTFNLDSSLQTGMYFIEVKTKDQRYFHKLIKK